MQVNQFLKEWNEAKNDEQKRRDLAEDIWYDWFCSSTALYNRTKKLIRPLTIMVKQNPKIGKLEVSGKNCCPLIGSLYDVLRLFNSDKKNKFRAYISFDSRQDKPIQACIENKAECGFDNSKSAAEFVANNIK